MIFVPNLFQISGGIDPVSRIVLVLGPGVGSGSGPSSGPVPESDFGKGSGSENGFAPGSIPGRDLKIFAFFLVRRKTPESNRISSVPTSISFH